MRIRTVKDLDGFKDVLSKCKGKVALISSKGDYFSLSSSLSQQVGLAELIKNDIPDLELFCEDKRDEGLFFKFFGEAPQVLA